MSEVSLLHITNPRSLLLIDLQALILKGFATSPLIEDAGEALIELSEYIDDSRVALFVVREAGLYVGFAFAENNPSAFTNACSVLHFYNKGTAAARKALIHAVVAFARAGKMRKIRGIDINQQPGAFARLFNVGRSTRRGELIEFELEELKQ